MGGCGGGVWGVWQWVWGVEFGVCGNGCGVCGSGGVVYGVSALHVLSSLSLSEPTLRLVLNDIAPYCVVTWQSVTSDELPELNGPEDDAMYIVVWQEVEGEAPRSNTSSFPFDITTNVILLTP